jgi:excisionase family DNA binding protein
MHTHIEQHGIDRASDSVLTKPELATRLRRSPRTVDSWMKQKKLPYFKVGKSVLFRWEHVLQKLDSFRVN